MTVIEFYDSTVMHNVLSTLLLVPDRLVLFGSSGREMYTFSLRLRDFCRKRGLPTQIEVIPTRTDSFKGVLQKLEMLVEKYPDCVFDLSGGQTEILVAMGALSRKYGVPMHRTDPARCRLMPFSQADVYPPVRDVHLTTGEFIQLHGGNMTDAFSPAPHDKAFWQDVLSVWSVCRQNSRAWNTALSVLHANISPNQTSVELDLQDLQKKFSSQKTDALLQTLKSLRKVGMLTDFRETGHRLNFRYKNNTVRLALSKEGTVLELYTYYIAFVRHRHSFFSDAAIGANLGWADKTHSHSDIEVKNEIDVFLMQGITPVFISCKNGFVDTDELYKLAVVASRFGGPYAKTAIILTGHTPDLSFLNRAKELGIRVIQSAHPLSPDAFSNKIKVWIAKTNKKENFS